MKRQWKELTMLTFALLLSIVGCVPSATPTPSVVQVTKVVETAKAVEVACETVKFTIRTDSTTAGGILATGTLTRCGTPLEKVEIKGKNRRTGDTGKATTDAKGQVKIGNVIGGRVMDEDVIQIEFTVDGKAYKMCFKATVETSKDWDSVPCPP